MACACFCSKFLYSLRYEGLVYWREIKRVLDIMFQNVSEAVATFRLIFSDKACIGMLTWSVPTAGGVVVQLFSCSFPKAHNHDTHIYGFVVDGEPNKAK